MANSNGNNNDKGNGLNLGDIGMIRNILMGDQITDFEARFNTIQEQIADLKKELSSKITELDSATQKSFSSMDKEHTMKFEDIEKQLISNVEKLNNRIDKVSKDDKMRLGKMLDKVSKQLMGE